MKIQKIPRVSRAAIIDATGKFLLGAAVICALALSSGCGGGFGSDSGNAGEFTNTLFNTGKKTADTTKPALQPAQE